MSTNQLAERFGAVSMTLEMPFKDHDANADTALGWSDERSKRLAHACLETLAQLITALSWRAATPGSAAAFVDGRASGGYPASPNTRFTETALETTGRRTAGKARAHPR